MALPRQLVPLFAMVSIVLAGTAWAGSGEMPQTASYPPATVQDGSSQPPSVAALPSPQLAPQQVAASVPAAPPRGGNGGDDRRLFMLMMLGQVMSGGAFGRFGQ